MSDFTPEGKDGIKLSYLNELVQCPHPCHHCLGGEHQQNKIKPTFIDTESKLMITSGEKDWGK